MRAIISIAVAVLMLASLGGCVSSTETDPRKGGLFGYNPEAYEKRIDDRKSTLSNTEADTQTHKQQTRQLEASKQKKLTQHEALKAKLAALYSESRKLESQLKMTKAANTAQAKELNRLKNEVAALRSSTIKTNNSNASDAAKQAKIKQLQQRMDELLEEADALSSL